MSIVAEEFADENKHIPTQIKLAHVALVQRGGYQPKPKRFFKMSFEGCVCRERLGQLRMVEKVQIELRALSRRVISPVPQLMNQPSNPSSGKSTITIVHRIFVIRAC